MLGRLRMSLNDCEKAYLKLSESVFNPKRHSSNLVGRVTDMILVKGRFDTQELENSIKGTIESQNFQVDELLQDEESQCKV
jgi:hypothetical protein